MSRSRSSSSSSTSSSERSDHWDGESGYRLHLSNLAVGVEQDEIEKLFQPFGPLNEVWVASRPPCFAFINFRYQSDAERAIKELDGTKIDGSRIRLDWARKRRYGSPSRRFDHRYSRSPKRRRRSSTPPSRTSGYRRQCRDSSTSSNDSKHE